MFWRRGGKKSDDASASHGKKEDEDDLKSLQRQFGIKTVSDKEVEAEFLKLMGGGKQPQPGGGKPGGNGFSLGLSPRSELALFGGGGDSDDEEAKILKEFNLAGNLDAIDANELSGEDGDDDSDSDDEHPADPKAAKLAKQELRGVLAEARRSAQANAAAASKGGPFESSREPPRQRQSEPPRTAPVAVKAVVIAAPKAETASTGSVHRQQQPITAEIDEEHVDVTDEDMNDPVFAAELAKMGFQPPRPPPQVARPRQSNPTAATAATKQVVLDGDDHHGDGHAEEEDQDVDVTEDDMNDPAFAAELAKMGFQSSVKADVKVPVARAENKVDTQATPPSPPQQKQQQPRVLPTQSKHFVHRKSSVDDSDLIDEFEEEDDDDDDEYEEKATGPPPPPPTVAALPIITASTTEAPSTERSGGATVESLMVEVTRAKQAAVGLKRQGDIQGAVEMMRRVKQIENLISMKQQQQVFIPPPVVVSVSAVVSREERERNHQFDALDSLLVQFANDATRLAKEHLAAANRVKAAEWLAKRKEYSAHLVTLREKRTVFGQPPPFFQIQQLREQVQVENLEIASDEVHLQIVAVHELKQASGKDVFVKYNLGFPSSSPHEGKTGQYKISTNVPFSTGPFPQSHQENLFRGKIQRSRGTQRLFEIKKAVFEVWRPGSLLRNAELIARGNQELAPLLSTSEIKCRVPFVGSNRKPVGGDVEICLRLRTPLRDKEFREVVTEILHIGAYAPPIIPPLAVVQSPPVAHVHHGRPHSHSEVAATRSTVMPPPPRTQSVPVMATTPPPPQRSPPLPPPQRSPPLPPPPSSVAAEDLEDPHDLDLIVSYDVMNDEIERIEAALPNLQGNLALEYTDRLDALGLKKQLLEIEMQTERLTLDMYIVRLKQRILDDRMLIKRLMKSGRKPDAARVLHRVKLMEKELQGTEEEEPGHDA